MRGRHREPEKRVAEVHDKGGGAIVAILLAGHMQMMVLAVVRRLDVIFPRRQSHPCATPAHKMAFIPADNLNVDIVVVLNFKDVHSANLKFASLLRCSGQRLVS